MSSLTCTLLYFLPMAAATMASAEPQKNTLEFPRTRPTDAVPAPPDFVALGFETAYMDNYANSPDNFTQNLIESLSKRTGTRPVIRVGGTSGDRVTFNPNLAETTKKCIDGECPDGSSASFELGPAYFDAFKRLSGVRWTIQAPLPSPPKQQQGQEEQFDDMRRTLTYVRRAWEALGDGENVAAIALGNEPNLDGYKRPEQYVKAAKRTQKAIIEELGLGEDEGGRAAKIFEVGDITAGAAGSGVPYDLKDVFQAGFDDDKNVKLAADHYYQISKGSSPDFDPGNWDMDLLQSTLMNHTAIMQGLSHHFKTARFFDGSPFVRYILSETGSVTVGGPVEFVSGFGACLWSVDFQLASLAMGAHRVVDSGRPAALHASWVPDNSAAPKVPGPRVQAPWLANIFVAAFIGRDDVRRDMVRLRVPGESLAGYAAYSGDGDGTLDRFALINMRAWNGTLEGPDTRGNETFILPLTDDDVGSVKVRRLRADSGVGAVGYDVGGPESNITYAGEQWSYQVDRGMGHFPGGRGVEEETIQVRDGEASIEVPDSEAVVVYVR